jgi:hypothetical protein
MFDFILYSNIIFAKCVVHDFGILSYPSLIIVYVIGDFSNTHIKKNTGV